MVPLASFVWSDKRPLQTDLLGLIFNPSPPLLCMIHISFYLRVLSRDWNTTERIFAYKQWEIFPYRKIRKRRSHQPLHTTTAPTLSLAITIRSTFEQSNIGVSWIFFSHIGIVVLRKQGLHSRGATYTHTSFFSPAGSCGTQWHHLPSFTSVTISEGGSKVGRVYTISMPSCIMHCIWSVTGSWISCPEIAGWGANW